MWFLDKTSSKSNTIDFKDEYNDDHTTCFESSDWYSATNSCTSIRRQKCRNCRKIYLVYMSALEEFCSIDCKSNAAYLANVHTLIRRQQEILVKKKKASINTCTGLDMSPKESTCASRVMCITPPSIGCEDSYFASDCRQQLIERFSTASMDETGLAAYSH